MKNRNTWIIAGFLLLIFGITSIILQLVGVHWAFLKFLEIPGRLFSFMAKIIMAAAGIIMIVLANTDWERERRESSEP